jgi:hypothetical protein
MKIRIDKTLKECLKTNDKWCRLRRKGRTAAYGLVLVETLCELESRGDAMRYLDSKGRTAWRATPGLRDYINDLRRDAEADLDREAE